MRQLIKTVNMKKLVIFDLDGTLLNSIADLGNACNYALHNKGFSEHPISSYNYLVGGGIRNLMVKAAPDASEGMIDSLLYDFRKYYDQHCTDETEPYPGIVELLHTLRERGIDIAVASNKYQEAAEKIIKHYFPDIDFVEIRGEQEGYPRKPDPSILFAILSSHPTAKKDVLMVGDSNVDIETARRACVESAGVTWGFRPVSELRKACADNIVSSTADLLEVISRDQ